MPQRTVGLQSMNMTYEVVTRFEFEMDEAERRAVGQLFPAHWGNGEVSVRERGWSQNEPACRILLIRDGHIVGNASVCEATNGLPRGLGIGDVVISEQLRGKGLGRQLLTATDQFFLDSGAEFAIAASRNLGVRKVLRGLGYRTPGVSSVYFRRGDYWNWNETWLLKGDLHPSAPAELRTDI